MKNTVLAVFIAATAFTTPLIATSTASAAKVCYEQVVKHCVEVKE